MPCVRFLAPPEAKRACVVTCRRDCVTTDAGPETGCDSCWSRWKVRHRSVLLERREGGRPCIDLAEVIIIITTITSCTCSPGRCSCRVGINGKSGKNAHLPGSHVFKAIVIESLGSR